MTRHGSLLTSRWVRVVSIDRPLERGWQRVGLTPEGMAAAAGLLGALPERALPFAGDLLSLGALTLRGYCLEVRTPRRRGRR